MQTHRLNKYKQIRNCYSKLEWSILYFGFIKNYSKVVVKYTKGTPKCISPKESQSVYLSD